MTTEQTTDGQIETYLESYRALMGFVPPRVQSRFDALRDENPELLIAQERVRSLIAYTPHLDQKTVQLILFAVLALELRDAARLHGVAARRAGASWEELRATLDLAFLFGGLSVANHAPGIIDAVRELEEQNRRRADPEGAAERGDE